MIEEQHYLQKIFLPTLLTAGRYALEIQSEVQERNPKEQFDNRFGQALTDADLAVQNFLEVTALSHFPQYGFFGEEYELSLNTQYFKPNAELTLVVDPIDCTRYYADGRKYFGIIISLINKTSYLAAMLHVPAAECCFHAEVPSGAFCAQAKDMQCGMSGAKLQLKPESPIVLTNNSPEVVEALQDEFTVIDITADYDQRQDINPYAVLFGEAAAYVGKNSSILDWGATAFIVEQAGGCASDWQGNPLLAISELQDGRYQSTVIAANKAVSSRIVEKLA